MRREVLSQLHESHQGSVRTKSRAHLIVYWPGLDNDPDNIVLSCKHCQERLPSLPKEPILLPTRPFKRLHWTFVLTQLTKFFIVDCFSDWPEIIHMGTNTTTPRLLTALKQTFCRSGAPDIVWSDRGPQFYFFMIFLWSGASSTTRLPLPTPRATAKQKRLLSP